MEFQLIQFNGNRDLRCSLDLLTDGLQFSFEVPHARELIWPDYESIRRADNLWLSTCFELFLAGESQPGYTEFNVSPSGAWNCYRFDDYRHGMQPSPCWQLTELEQDDEGDHCSDEVSPLQSELVKLACLTVDHLQG